MKTQSDLNEVWRTSPKASVPKAQTKAHSYLIVVVYQEWGMKTATDFVTIVRNASLNQIKHMTIPKFRKMGPRKKLK